MRQFIKPVVIFLSLCGFNNLVFAGPWFTGPLLAPAGHTIPNGHTNLEMYGIDVFSNGRFDQSGNLIHTPLFRSVVANPIISHGFTDWLDAQISIPYVFNSTLGKNSNKITDISTALGIQLVEQKGSPTRADVRILLQEVFPTGRFENLNPALLGTDSTGLGSYQTQIGLNLQYLREIYNGHYLRSRLILSHLHASAVNINGFTSYGGSANAHGRVSAGSENDINLGFEYTLTQNWVAVLEGTYSKGNSTRFSGDLNVGNLGGPQSNIGYPDYDETALAPAIEYNFNSHIGVIGGVWFPLTGKNTSHYMTYLLALNTYW
jgi:hypothetical protein